jgi:hypothetical protein
MANRSAALIKDLDNLEADGYWGLPVTELPVLNRHGIPVMVDLDLATDVEATQHMCIAGRHDQVTIPSLNTGGWFDSCIQGTLDAYTTMRISDKSHG